MIPAANTKSLRAFIDPKKVFDQDEAHDILKLFEIETLVSTDTVLYLRKVTFSQSDDFIEYHYLKPWFRASCHLAEERPDKLSDEEMKKVALFAREIIIVMCEFGEDESGGVSKHIKEISTITVTDRGPLRAFINSEEVYGEEKARDILGLFKLGVSVSVDTVLQLRDVVTVSESGQFIEYQFLKPWLYLRLTKLAGLGKKSDEEIKEIALTKRHYAVIFFGSLASSGDNKNAEMKAMALLARDMEAKSLRLAKDLRDKEATRVRELQDYFAAHPEIDPERKQAHLEQLEASFQWGERYLIQPMHDMVTQFAEWLEDQAAFK